MKTVGYRGLIQVLQDEDAYPDALETAAENGNYNVALSLLQQGENPNQNNGAPLRWATYKGHYKVAKLLIENGAEVNIVKDPPLVYACSQGYLDIVKLLLHHEANPNVNEGEALKIAEHNEERYPDTLTYPKICELLKNIGANDDER